MTVVLAALAGFSIGMAGLLAVAMGTAYRDLPLSWTARFGGGVMLAGLAHTSWHHIGFAALVDAAPAPIYGWGLFLQWAVLAVLTDLLQVVAAQAWVFQTSRHCTRG